MAGLVEAIEKQLALKQGRTLPLPAPPEPGQFLVEVPLPWPLEQ